MPAVAQLVTNPLRRSLNSFAEHDGHTAHAMVYVLFIAQCGY